jgi:hypothetical protein
MATNQETHRPIYKIAKEIQQIWSKQGRGVNYAAKPYLDAMRSLNSIDQDYGADDARSIVRYFLSNASSFKGEDARRLKAELKAML